MLLWVALFCLGFCSQVADSHRAPLSIHVLNVLTGLPATGLQVQYFRLGDFNMEWTELMQSSTDNDGRLSIVSGLDFERLQPATYKVRFETGAYWQQQGLTSFHPYVEVVFTATEKENRVHVPLLLSPYSYTTYRGS